MILEKPAARPPERSGPRWPRVSRAIRPRGEIRRDPRAYVGRREQGARAGDEPPSSACAAGRRAPSSRVRPRPRARLIRRLDDPPRRPPDLPALLLAAAGARDAARAGVGRPGSRGGGGDGTGRGLDPGVGALLRRGGGRCAAPAAAGLGHAGPRRAGRRDGRVARGRPGRLRRRFRRRSHARAQARDHARQRRGSLRGDGHRVLAAPALLRDRVRDHGGARGDRDRRRRGAVARRLLRAAGAPAAGPVPKASGPSRRRAGERWSCRVSSRSP